MQVRRFTNYDQYVRVQTEANKAKLQHVWASEKEIRAVAGYVKRRLPQPSLGICHGVRNGWEVARLRAMLGIPVIGTELSDTATRFENVIQWDFHDVKEEWLDGVDFIYSNAWDHSYAPRFCLDQWMKCVKPTGRCFLEWSTAHDEGGCSDCDCFGASFEEYREIISQKYLVDDVLRISRRRWSRLRNALRFRPPRNRGWTRLVFVIRHR